MYLGSCGPFVGENRGSGTPLGILTELTFWGTVAIGVPGGFVTVAMDLSGKNVGQGPPSVQGNAPHGGRNQTFSCLHVYMFTCLHVYMLTCLHVYILHTF